MVQLNIPDSLSIRLLQMCSKAATFDLTVKRIPVNQFEPLGCL